MTIPPRYAHNVVAFKKQEGPTLLVRCQCDLCANDKQSTYLHSLRLMIELQQLDADKFSLRRAA